MLILGSNNRQLKRHVSQHINMFRTPESHNRRHKNTHTHFSHVSRLFHLCVCVCSLNPNIYEPGIFTIASRSPFGIYGREIWRTHNKAQSTYTRGPTHICLSWIGHRGDSDILCIKKPLAKAAAAATPFVLIKNSRTRLGWLVEALCMALSNRWCMRAGHKSDTRANCSLINDDQWCVCMFFFILFAIYIC